MAKPKLSDFKKYIGEMNQTDLQKELIKLFSKLNQVQEFYAQELLSEDERQEILAEYKDKIYKEFWTRTGNPRSPSNARIRELISHYENVSVFPFDVIDLILYRVETATQFADEFGGMTDGSYNASSNAFEKALKLMQKHQLFEEFKLRCEDLFSYDNLDHWYIDDLENLYEEYQK